MCATVCPSGALAFTTREQIDHTRQGSAIREWMFGGEVVKTKVNVMVPREIQRVDVGVARLSGSQTDEYDVAGLLRGE